MNIFQKHKAYGYKKVKKPLTIDNKMFKIYNTLYQNKERPNIGKNDYPYDVSNLCRDTFNFFEQNNLELHEVPSINMIDLDGLIYYGREFSENMLTLVNPLNLTVEYSLKSVFSGSVSKIVNMSDSVIFLCIRLSREINKMLLPAYVHEIVHTQVDSVKGSVENYNNSELLSIFMEKLIAMQNGDMKFLQTIEDIRSYYNLVFLSSLMVEKNIQESDIIESSMYIESSLKANNLFYTYLESDDRTKREIMRKIQSVFDEKITVEEVLDYMDINMENSSTDKVLKKSLFK